MRAMRVTLLAVCLALVMASSAGAATGYRPPGVSLPPATEEAKLAAYLGVARSYWPGSRCAGRETVRLRAEGQIAQWRPDRPGAQGIALVDTCEALISGGLSRGGFCSVLAHELGHLAGHEHTPAGTSVMSPEVPTVGACLAAAEGPTARRSEDWYATVALLPNGGRGWHITPPIAGRATAVARTTRCQRVVLFDDDEGQVFVGRCHHWSRRSRPTAGT